MSIQKISATNSIPSASLDGLGPVGIPLSEPSCQLRGLKKVIPGKESTDTGIWECSPGKFRRQIVAGEVMHILAGECTFTNEEGEVTHIKAGDSLFFPPNTTGVWDIKSTLRKIYVLI